MNTYGNDARRFVKVLQPSVLSSTISFVVGVGILLALSFPQLLTMYGIGEYVTYVRDRPGDLMVRYSEASDALNSSDLAADTSVFLVWGIAGLIGYALVSALIRAVRNIIEFERDVEYFQKDRAGIVREALLHILIRLVAASLIIGMYVIGTTVLIPAVTVSVQTALSGTLVMGIGLYAATLAIIMVALHIVAILIRLVLLRTRVFYDKYYVAT